MKLPKQKSAVVVDKVKHRLENPLAKAQKSEKLRMMPSGNVRFSERQIEIARDLALWWRNEALRGPKG